jgi:hypothetical protein
VNALHREVLREIAEAARIGREHETRGMEMRLTSGPGAAGRWFCGPHPVKRWREYFAPSATYEQALGQLITEIDGARFVKALDTGPQLWRGPRPRRARFVVSVCSEGMLPALVTVLPPFDGHRRK